VAPPARVPMGMEGIAAPARTYGAPLLFLVGHRVAQALDRMVGRDLEAVEMEQAVQFGELTFAVAAEQGEADRSQGAALERSGALADRWQGELLRRWRLSPGDAEHHRPEPVGELGEMSRGGAASLDEVEEVAVVHGELDDGAVVVGAGHREGVVVRQRRGAPQGQQDRRAVRGHGDSLPRAGGGSSGNTPGASDRRRHAPTPPHRLQPRAPSSRNRYRFAVEGSARGGWGVRRRGRGAGRRVRRGRARRGGARGACSDGCDLGVEGASVDPSVKVPGKVAAHGVSL
jgi:hypothetical protein